jgi:hypothetical protein
MGFMQKCACAAAATSRVLTCGCRYYHKGAYFMDDAQVKLFGAALLLLLYPNHLFAAGAHREYLQQVGITVVFCSGFRGLLTHHVDVEQGLQRAHGG